MKKYEITGMSCAACQARVEKAVMKVDGVESCAVSLLTNSMGVEGTASDEDIIQAVVNAGYGVRDNTKGETDEQDVLADTESPVLVRRLVLSIPLMIIIMYLSMGHTMWGWPVFSFMDNPTFMNLSQMFLAGAVMIINRKFFISGFRSLFTGSPNMDTLVALGSTASFVYMYFDSAAMIPTLITVGKLLEAKSKGRTTDALKSLMKLSPKEAVVLREDNEVTVPVDELSIGDVYILRAGDIVPVDGTVIEGDSAINESALTGESIPVDKTTGDRVSAGTINMNGYLKCKAVRVGEDTTLSQIIHMVEDAATTKAPLARIADKVSGIFVPVVIGLAVLTFIVWMIIGEDVSFSLSRAISVLVISCPCALGLATPVAIMVGNGVGAKNGILYKKAEALESAGRIGIVVLDKTGTITKGLPEVTDVIAAEDITENELIKLAYSLEKMSEHPLGRAVVEYAEAHYSIDEGYKLSGFETMPGAGVKAELQGAVIEGGSYRYIMSQIDSERSGELSRYEADINNLTKQGKTPLVFIKDKKLVGIIAVADQIKEDSEAAVKELKGMGIYTVMLTGDNNDTANAIAEKVGINKVIAGVMPDEKEMVINSLQNIMLTDKKSIKVAMVGDGINDAVALTRADTGFAIGAGTDVAVDSADAVLMKNSLRDVAAAIRISRATIRNIHQNLFWAFFYNALCIPLAMGVYGIAMKPMYGAAAMALSSFFVCMNALRLNLVKVYDSSRDKNIGFITDAGIKNRIDETVSDITDEINNKNEDGGGIMKKTISIEGMMCEHCEATVKKALEAVEGVKDAKVSHKKGTAVIKLEQDIDEDILKKAVEDKDYKVLEIK